MLCTPSIIDANRCFLITSASTRPPLSLHFSLTVDVKSSFKPLVTSTFLPTSSHPDDFVDAIFSYLDGLASKRPAPRAPALPAGNCPARTAAIKRGDWLSRPGEPNGGRPAGRGICVRKPMLNADQSAHGILIIRKVLIPVHAVKKDCAFS